MFFPEFSLQDRDSMEGQTDDECINPSFATFLHYPQSPDTIFKTLSRTGSAPANFFCGSPLCVDNVVTTTVAPLSVPIVSSTTVPTMKFLTSQTANVGRRDESGSEGDASLFSSEEEQRSASMLNDESSSSESPLMFPRLFDTINDGSTNVHEDELLLLGGLIDLDSDKYSPFHQRFCYPEQKKSRNASEPGTLGEFVTPNVQDRQFNTNTSRHRHTFTTDNTISFNNNIDDDNNMYALQEERPDINSTITTVNDYNAFSTSPSISLLHNSSVYEAVAEATAKPNVISTSMARETYIDNGLSKHDNQTKSLNSLKICQTSENAFQDRVEETIEPQSVLNKSSPSEITSLSDVEATTISNICNNNGIKHDLVPEFRFVVSSLPIVPSAQNLIEKAPTIAKWAQSDNKFLRRCSLSKRNEKTYRSGKSRKCVRFADECGFCLESIRIMTEPSDCPPTISLSVLKRCRQAARATAREMSLRTVGKSDKLISAAAHKDHTLDWLELEDDESGTDADDEAGKCERSAINCSASTFIRKIQTSPMLFSQASQMRNTPIKHHNTDKKPMWTMEFRQPASDYIRFRDTLKHQKIACENVMVKDQVGRMLGTIKVSNISYEKRVFLRMTHDGWKSFTDHPATYQASPSRNFDIFKFDVDLPKPPKHQLQYQQKIPNSLIKVEFCVSFVAGENGSLGQYWDSNGGRNFILTFSFPSPLFLGRSTS